MPAPLRDVLLHRTLRHSALTTSGVQEEPPIIRSAAQGTPQDVWAIIIAFAVDAKEVREFFSKPAEMWSDRRTVIDSLRWEDAHSHWTRSREGKTLRLVCRLWRDEIDRLARAWAGKVARFDEIASSDISIASLYKLYHLVRLASISNLEVVAIHPHNNVQRTLERVL